VPVGNVLVGDTGSDIEHDDTALAVDIISISKTSKLLLSCGIPNIELDVTQALGGVSKFLFVENIDTYRAESKRVNFDTEGSNILLLKFSSQMALDEGCL
jgi:hypothetical protein